MEQAITTTEEVLEYLISIDGFKCELEYKFEYNDGGFHDAQDFCQIPYGDEQVEIDFKDKTSTFDLKASVDGIAKIKSEDIIKVILSDDHPPETYVDIIKVVKAMIHRCTSDQYFDGMISIYDIEEYS
jgi:hypothetical protein